MTRTPAKQDLVRDLGATPVVADALEPEQVAAAVAETQPEAIVHQLTALSGGFDLKHFERTFALTNRLRTEGTDNLLSAGRALGIRRFVAQSYAGWPFARSGAAVKAEEEPLDPAPVDAMRSTLDAIRYVEDVVMAAHWTEGVVLRYGGFYGPGTSLGPDGGDTVEAIRKRRFPVVGSGAGVWSFVHVEDAAEATVAAVERGRGIYNIVDDEPAPVAEWLPEVAAAFGAKPPRHVPRVVGRLVAGEAATVMMTEVRGASNEKAKRELGWQPRHRSWREGFVEAAAA